MKNYVRLILILSFFLVSCNKGNNVDHSLTLEEYQELGMPDYNRVWNMEDYSNAFYALNTLKYQNLMALPSRDSEKSGVLFSRMISIDNLSFLQDEALPLWAKAGKIKWFVNTLMELKVAYTTFGMSTQYYVRELNDIDITRLRVAQRMLELGIEINESEDLSDVDMQSDYPAIQKMYLSLLSELFEKQQHTSLYPQQMLELLSDSLSSSVQRNMPWFDEEASAFIKQAMLSVIDSTSSRKIRNDYKEVTEIL